MNGPALAVRGQQVSIAWFTKGADGRPLVKLMTSDDGGENFLEPRFVDNHKPIGRVDVTILSDGSTVVLWVANSGAGAAILVRRYAAIDNPSPVSPVARIKSTRSSGFPRIEAIGDTALVAWTGDDSRVHTASVKKD